MLIYDYFKESREIAAVDKYHPKQFVSNRNDLG